MAFAHVLQEQNYGFAAVPHMETAERILGPSAIVSGHKANIMRNAMRLPEAIAAATAAVSAAPENPQYHAMLANHYQAEGRLDEMDAAIFEAVKRFGATNPAIRRMGAIAAMERKEPARALEYLAGDNLGELDLFERGRVFEALGEYGRAWSDWMSAKELQRKRGCIWNKPEAERRFALLADSARPGRFDKLPKAPPATIGPQPIFITGLPRSGTTMLEAALSAHPTIAGGDEMMALPDTIQLLPGLLNMRAPYPLILGALRLAENAAAPELLRDFYLRRAWQKLGQAVLNDKPREARPVRWFTDKMPSNELHWPLINLLFPASPIIATRRHPLDVVVSNMAHFLVHGGFISCSLDGFAAHLVMVADLLELYERYLPALNLKRVPYEQFVADHRAGIDAIMPPGLVATEGCYDFHLSAWRSRTISHRQIKQAVNDKSVGRYKNFLPFLEPVLPTLAPTIERLGYGI